MSSTDVFLRQATHADVEAIVELLNLTYRSDVGWTNEAHLVSGIRTTPSEISSIINDSTTYFFVYPQVEQIDASKDKVETGQMLATISVQFKPEQNTAYIGSFAVEPQLQGQGVGNTILDAAETFAQRHLSGSDPSNDNSNDKLNDKLHDKSGNKICLSMSILPHRPELLAYYQRRGYVLNGDNQPFPINSHNGEPIVDDLQLLGLEKWV